MDSFELTKIAAAVLAAALLIFGTGTFIEIANAPHGDHDVVGYSLAPEGDDEGDGSAEVADAGGKAEAAPEPAGFDAAAVVAAASTASPEAGQKLFNACKACHSNNEGGANKVGPALWGIVGRDKGSVDGFKYSGKLQEMEGAWTLDALAGFIHNPKEYAPGTKMIYRGLKDDKKLANLLSYLNSLK
ncbi:MAG: cytochrome c family protein [Pseudomonadota bacterium]